MCRDKHYACVHQYVCLALTTHMLPAHVASRSVSSGRVHSPTHRSLPYTCCGHSTGHGCTTFFFLPCVCVCVCVCVCSGVRACCVVGEDWICVRGSCQRTELVVCLWQNVCFDIAHKRGIFVCLVPAVTRMY